jgi:hypothetical protein
LIVWPCFHFLTFLCVYSGIFLAITLTVALNTITQQPQNLLMLATHRLLFVNAALSQDSVAKSFAFVQQTVPIDGRDATACTQSLKALQYSVFRNCSLSCHIHPAVSGNAELLSALVSKLVANAILMYVAAVCVLQLNPQERWELRRRDYSCCRNPVVSAEIA